MLKPTKVENVFVNNAEEYTHVKKNQEVIREYLIGQFKGFELTDTPHRPLSHMFTVTKSSEERYKLKVAWPQLSDRSNTPEKTIQRLVTDDVAGRMRAKSQGEYFSWGYH
jgi:hypothetical protein